MRSAGYMLISPGLKVPRLSPLFLPIKVVLRQKKWLWNIGGIILMGKHTTY
jgi:hypothetical protein